MIPPAEAFPDSHKVSENVARYETAARTPE